jgi:hypothetical protein
MSFRELFRWSALAAIVSGLLEMLGAAGFVLTALVPVIPDAPIWLLFFSANLFLVFGLMGIYGCQVEEIGRLGAAGFVMTTLGMLLHISAFFPPSGAALFLLGALVFALANQQAGLLPSWGPWLWLAGPLFSLVAGYLGLPLLEAGIGPALSGLGSLSLGAALLSRVRQQGGGPTAVA